MKGKKIYSLMCTLCLMFVLSGCTDGNGQSGSAEKKSGGQSDAQISEEEAKAIALERVTGATEENIREFQIDRRNGLLEYEGKIFYNGREYEFEIDGSDGAVLEWEIEDI